MWKLYYLLGVLAIFFELRVLLFPERYIAFKEEMDNDIEPTHREILFSSAMVGYWVWVFVGLFSDQWVLFMLFGVSSLIPTFNNRTFIRVDALASLLVVSFLVINGIQPQVDVTEVLIKLFE